MARSTNTAGISLMRIDRWLLWVLLLVILVVILWLALDHILFPDLPVPAGAPSIIK